MERFIEIYKDPFGEGFDICNEDGISFQEGISIIVGCNGIGKTTTIHCIKEELHKLDIPYMSHDNHSANNKSNTMESALYNNNFTILATAATSSEGENISISLGSTMRQIFNFLKTGRTEDDKLDDLWLFNDDREEHEQRKKRREECRERWLFFDAIDSGYSIDNIIEFKECLDLILKDSKKMNMHTFIIITANSYEMTVDLPCIDLWTGKNIEFKDYDDYKKYILETSKRKEERYKKKRKSSRKHEFIRETV